MFQSTDDGIHLPSNKPLKPVQEGNLIELAQARNEEAFTILFSQYKLRICTYLAGLVEHPEDRDDLAQETFMRAWKELPNLRQISRFEPWLYRIATNVARDYRRQQKRHSQLVPLEDGEGPDNLVNLEERVAERELVKLALKGVPWKYRLCLLLKSEGRLSKDEIAEVAEVSKKSVGTYVSIGRRYFLQAYYHLENERNTLKERRPIP